MSRSSAWIASPRYDLPLLSLAPFLGIVVCGLAFSVDSITLSAVSLFALGMPHYLSTYTFFLGDENMAYYRTRKLAFFGGPILIGAFLTASLALHLFFFVALVVDVWNVYHVSRQSIGILGVYRHLGGGNNLLEKLPANLALLGIGGGLYAVHVDNQPSAMHYLSKLSVNLAPYIGPLLLVIGGLSLAVLVRRMFMRKALPSWAEIVFLLGSLVLFTPYIILDSRSTASSAMLSGHYVQYMALLWLLNMRKYGSSSAGSTAQRALTWISSSWQRVLGFLLLLVACASVVDRVVHHVNAVALHTWLLNMVVLLHFYYDGLFWAFKRPEVRTSLGPYLVSPTRDVATAAVSAGKVAVA